VSEQFKLEPWQEALLADDFRMPTAAEREFAARRAGRQWRFTVETLCVVATGERVAIGMPFPNGVMLHA
jgi:hypothetical protein